jgi:hypothetical protein
VNDIIDGDDFVFMDACIVDCHVCGDGVGRALHLCSAKESCINLCPSCLRTIMSAMPDGWLAPGYRPLEDCMPDHCVCIAQGKSESCTLEVKG